MHNNKILVDIKFNNSLKYICLVGHVDIVKEGNLDKWESDLFKLDMIGKSDNGDKDLFKNINFVGRGVSDMKSFLAIMLTILETIKWLNPKYNLRFIFYDKEEEAKITGMEELIGSQHEYMNKFFEDVEIVIIGEPTDGEIHYGVYSFLGGDIKITGIGGHSSINFKDQTPHYKYNKLFLKVNEIVDYYKDKVIFNFTSLFSESNSRNTVPSIITASYTLRIYPDDRLIKEVKAKLLELLSSNNIENNIYQDVNGYKSSIDKVRKFFNENCKYKNFVYKIAPYWSDLAIIGNNYKNIVVNWGPGNIKEAHSYNESINGNELFKYLYDVYTIIFR